MGVLLQVRDVPDDVHRVLKARAAAEGVSLSEYARRELAGAASRPTVAELTRRIAGYERPVGGEPSEDSVRAIRDSGE